MKHKEEPSVHSPRGNPSVQVDLYFPDDDGTETAGSLSRPGPTAAARAEQPALSDSSESLMELIVDDANVEAAWKNVKRNRGAPAPTVRRSTNSSRPFGTAGRRFDNNSLMARTNPRRFVAKPSTSPMADSVCSVFQTCKKG